MDDKELIRELNMALTLAGMYAHENLPSNFPKDMPLEVIQYLYMDSQNDIFGERFVAYWRKQARDLLNGKE